MSINLLDKVQQNLGYPTLLKIDPNTQTVPGNKKMGEHKFSQAAIPAVLTALYRYIQSEDGANDFLRDNNSSDWASKIFTDHTKEAVQTISSYAAETNADVVAKVNAIANESVKIVKENLPANAGIKELRLFFHHQKNNILLHLPAALDMGKLLHDKTLDDKTHKMQGPISSLMNSIGATFNNPVAEEKHYCDN